MEYWDLVTLQNTIREGLTELFPESVWVKAEIAAVQTRMNGHCYLDLVQSEDGRQVAKVKAVIWKSRFQMLRAFFKNATGKDLAVGQQIMVLAEINYSELYGLSLVIDEINPEFTIGDAELKKQQTIKQLQEEGMMDRQQKLELPEIPYKLAVISAPDAAGFGDFKRHLQENQYGFYFEVDLFPASMQGEKAPESIADALGQVEAVGFKGAKTPYDAVLILRGGGSNLDLACFDDYGLALAIAQCSIPVFTAIGHDKDYHIADMVAYRFVKTPTALADEFIQMYMAEDERISGLGARLARAFAAKIQQRLSALDELDRRIRAADPRAVLKRGYTLAVDSKGRVVKSKKGLAPGDKIQVLMSDGTIKATIEEII